MIGRDGGLSTLRHSCGFAGKQRVLNTFPGLGFLRYNTSAESRNENVKNKFL